MFNIKVIIITSFNGKMWKLTGFWLCLPLSFFFPCYGSEIPNRNPWLYNFPFCWRIPQFVSEAWWVCLYHLPFQRTSRIQISATSTNPSIRSFLPQQKPVTFLIFWWRIFLEWSRFKHEKKRKKNKSKFQQKLTLSPNIYNMYINITGQTHVHVS